jgi:hypothetical protein
MRPVKGCADQLSLACVGLERYNCAPSLQLAANKCPNDAALKPKDIDLGHMSHPRRLSVGFVRSSGEAPAPSTPPFLGGRVRILAEAPVSFAALRTTLVWRDSGAGVLWRNVARAAVLGGLMGVGLPGCWIEPVRPEQTAPSTKPLPNTVG